FSSRRRHTRSKRDWSSDVCSSNLWLRLQVYSRCTPVGPGSGASRPTGLYEEMDPPNVPAKGRSSTDARMYRWVSASGNQLVAEEIGRASCRERVWMWGGEVGAEAR